MATHPITDVPDMGRRQLFARCVQALYAAISGTLGVILGGAVLAPAFTSTPKPWLPAGPLDDLEDGVPVPVTVRAVRRDGYAQVSDRQVIFLVKTGERDVLALSSTCTHLGCRTRWDPPSGTIRCPCHGGVYDARGNVQAGPPPAPLARLETKVDGDLVRVRL